MKRIIDQRLAQARLRLRARTFLAIAAWSSAAALLLAGLWRAIHFAVSGYVDLAGADWWILLSLALVASALVAALTWRSLVAVARELDQRAEAKDRFVSVLALRDDPNARLIEEETARFSEQMNLPDNLGPRFPLRSLAVLTLALCLLGGTALLENHRTSRLAPAVAEARKQLAQAAELLKKNEPETPKLEEKTLQLETKMRELDRSSNPAKDAMRALADLEKELSAGDAKSKSLTTAERAALADAMAAKDPALAAALAEGANNQTADRISRLDPDALAQALEQAARHVESTRLREMMQQTRTEARQSLSLAYRRGEGVSSRTTELLQKLRDLKSGKPGDQPMAELAVKPGNDPAQSSREENTPPGGSAGQEKDFGTGKSLSEEQPAAGEEASRNLLIGQAGDGPAEATTFRVDGPDAGRAQRALANTRAAQAAQIDAVEQENIPPGSQLLVKRYFEAIRPAE